MGASNYLFGSDPASWIIDVPHFQKVNSMLFIRASMPFTTFQGRMNSNTIFW